eukprot:555926-Pyramimonas_sp.AAC.1
MELLDECDLHYVRCIKPNDLKAPDTFEGAMVLQQLQYSGVLETIKIRRAGYAVRIKFDSVIASFGR